MGAISRDGVDDRARRIGQPDRARPGLRIGKVVVSLAGYPVPFQGGDFADAVSGQNQLADYRDDLREKELVAGEHGVEEPRLAFLQGLESWERYPQSAALDANTSLT